MTTAAALDLPGHRHRTRAEQLKQLRRQMAAVAGKVGAGRTGSGSAGDSLPGSESLLAVPDLLAETLPAGLPRGAVAVLSGARSLPVSMVAAVTAAGGQVAIVGQPDIGLLAAAEMGADLGRLAVIPDPGADPVEIAAVLIDGMDLVVLGLGGRVVPPARAQVLATRTRHRGCTLLITDGDWPGATLRLEARVRGYDTSGYDTSGYDTSGYGTSGGYGTGDASAASNPGGTGDASAAGNTGAGAPPGCGRINGVRLAVRGAGRAGRVKTG